MMPMKKDGPQYHDKDCGFGDVPSFVNGTAMGLRSFDITPDGFLRGVTYKQIWRPGENVARCFVTKPTTIGTPAAETMTALRKKFDTVIAGIAFPFDDAEPEVFPGHQLQPCAGLEPDCACGFYAYHDGKRHAYFASSFAMGVIEGYGRVVLGPHGFRAQKARIVALVPPYADIEEKMNDLRANADQIADTIAKLPSGLLRVAKSTRSVAVLAGLVVVAAALNPQVRESAAMILGALSVLAFVSERYAREAVNTLRAVLKLGMHKAIDEMSELHETRGAQYAERIARMRERYPGIPVYGSQEEMLAAHPTEDLGYLVRPRPGGETS